LARVVEESVEEARDHDRRTMTETPFGTLIGQLAQADPDRAAVTCEGVTVSRGELEARTNRLARAYRELGVVPDSFVTIGLPNGIAFFGEIRILDPGGRELPPGQVSEIWMRRGGDAPPTYRYVGAEARSRPGNWESLGDVGWKDDEGYVYLSDRETDMILVGGSNVYPAEVEAALDEHPRVASSCVIGLPDEEYGNAVHAIVQALEPLTTTELETFLAARLVKYKRPCTYEFVSTPLRGDDGKVRRTALRAERLAARG
jgi:acyl-CoA synthetase (AMP-forming)/AMP-acid ligase II